jgi:hypothetical protein
VSRLRFACTAAYARAHRAASPYLPDSTLDESGTPASTVHCLMGPAKAQECISLNMFESIAMGLPLDSPFLLFSDAHLAEKLIPGSPAHVVNAGGPIWGVDWCPLSPSARACTRLFRPSSAGRQRIHAYANAREGQRHARTISPSHLGPRASSRRRSANAPHDQRRAACSFGLSRIRPPLLRMTRSGQRRPERLRKLPEGMRALCAASLCSASMVDPRTRSVGARSPPTET